MAIEFLVVTFPEQRAVLADGAGVGVTNHILMLPGDEYEITIDGDRCTPASRVIALAGTSMVRPMVVAFDTVTAAAVAGISLSAPTEADATEAMAPVDKMARAPVSSGIDARKKTGKRSASKMGDAAVAKPGRKAKKNA